MFSLHTHKHTHTHMVLLDRKCVCVCIGEREQSCSDFAPPAGNCRSVATLPTLQPAEKLRTSPWVQTGETVRKVHSWRGWEAHNSLIVFTNPSSVQYNVSLQEQQDRSDCGECAGLPEAENVFCIAVCVLASVHFDRHTPTESFQFPRITTLGVMLLGQLLPLLWA